MIRWHALVAVLAGLLASGFATARAAPESTGPPSFRAPAGGGIFAADTILTRFGYNPSGGPAAAGSTWTFDHGDPDPLEGWTAFDETANTFTAFRHLTAAIWSARNFIPTVPPAPVITDSGSVWMGFHDDEATSAGWAAGRGYGNDWAQRFYSPTFQNLSGDTVQVSFNYFLETEPNYDYVNVSVTDSSLGSRILLTSVDGTQGSPSTPINFSQDVVTGTGTFRLLFEFFSDAAWSDEDGLWPNTIGGIGIDDVQLTNVTPAGPWTFETGLEGWTAEPIPNVAPLAAVNDVAGFALPGCSLASNVVSFYDPADTTHPGGQMELFVSPAVPLDAFPPDRNIFVQMDLWGDLPPPDQVFWSWSFSHFDTTSGWTAPAGPGTNLFAGATCLSPRYFATDPGVGVFVPAGAESVRFNLHVRQTNAQGSGSYGSFPPLIDNIWIGVSAPRILHVPSPTFPDIGTAVDSAAVGDTVLVADGIYSGPGACGIDFGGKDITLLSESGAALTTIDCTESNRILLFQGGETAAAVVSGFTLTGGDSTVAGSAIRIGPGASSPTIQDCIVTGNSAQFPDSGVVLIEAGSPTFNRVTIAGNGANGGVAVITGGTPAFTAGAISNNQGTGLVADPVAATFTATTISANTGGGIHLRGSASTPAPFRADTCLTRPTFTGCIISGNTTTASGGGILVDPVTFCVYSPVFTSCVITGNSASGNGGGVALLGTVWDGATAPDFDLCTIAGNSAGGSGGAIYASAFDAAGLGQGIVYADGAIIWDNCASGGGGGQIHIDVDNQMVLSCALADTSAGAIQGAGSITLTSVSGESPGFCTASLCFDAPTVAGDFRVSPGSPAFPGEPGNPCGVPLGAFGAACSTSTDAPVVAVAPARTVLHPPRPNPFGTLTEIRYDVARPGRVSLKVYDVTGRRVASLVEGRRPAGMHRVAWNGRDSEGHVAATGVYFVRLVAGETVQTRRIVRLR